MEIKKALGIEAELVLGSGGIFQVSVDDRVVAERRFWHFPTEAEIVDAVSAALGK